MKVVFATATVKRPCDEYLAALEASIPLLDGAGIEHAAVYEVGCPYISSARATLLRKAMDTEPDAVVFIDHDMSWEPAGLNRLLSTDDDVLAATYRYRLDDESYMGTLIDGPEHRPVVRDDGCIAAELVPAGFLKVTKRAVHKFMGAYPDLIFGPRFHPSVDLFNHGAHDGLWWGEDYAFSRNWRAMGEKLWIMPDISITHHEGDKSFPGNFHEFLLRQPGGSNERIPGHRPGDADSGRDAERHGGHRAAAGDLGGRGGEPSDHEHRHDVRDDAERAGGHPAADAAPADHGDGHDGRRNPGMVLGE